MNEKTELLVDDEGENQAVRCFLMQYGTPPQTVGAMRRHMERCGFPEWPHWVKQQDQAHLTKAGAQLWLRHLFSLEAASPSSKSTKEAPDLWIIFDSQGPYDLRDSEEQAQRFCTHYNKREVDPLKPYTYRRYLASSSIKEDGERAEPNALDLLDKLFTAYEDGCDVYEDPGECAGHLGHAVKLDDETFHACADLLNRTRPRSPPSPLGDTPPRGYSEVDTSWSDAARIAHEKARSDSLGDTPDQQEQKR